MGVEAVKIEIDRKSIFDQALNDGAIKRKPRVSGVEIADKLHPTFVFLCQLFKTLFMRVQLRQDVPNVLF